MLMLHFTLMSARQKALVHVHVCLCLKVPSGFCKPQKLLEKETTYNSKHIEGMEVYTRCLGTKSALKQNNGRFDPLADEMTARHFLNTRSLWGRMSMVKPVTHRFLLF